MTMGCGVSTSCGEEDAMLEQRTPTLLEDLGQVAQLYGTVIWMFGQRVKYGPRWEEKLSNEAVRHLALAEDYQPEHAVRHTN
jgi:hypothetical protein